MKKPTIKQRIQKALSLCESADERAILFVYEDEKYCGVIILSPKNEKHVVHTVYGYTIAELREELRRLDVMVDGGISKRLFNRPVTE